MSGEVLIIEDDAMVKKYGKFVLDNDNDWSNMDEFGQPLKEKKYLIECPFESIHTNEVPLDACKGCYWNAGVINNLEGVPVKVKCQYMYHNDFVVQVFSDYHGE
jgi:hypothetical protein